LASASRAGSPSTSTNRWRFSTPASRKLDHTASRCAPSSTGTATCAGTRHTSDRMVKEWWDTPRCRSRASAKLTRRAATGRPPSAAAAFMLCPPASALTPHLVAVPRFPGPSATTTASARSSSLAASSPVQSGPVAASVPPAVPQGGAGGATNPVSGFAAMMKSPEMKEVNRVQTQVAVDRTYGSLFKDLNLSASDQEALKALLLDRQIAMMDAANSLMVASGSDARQAVAADANALKADYDKKIQDFLGAQNYPLFQQYEEIQPERSAIHMFKGTLPAGDALTNQQEDDLIAALYQERKALPAPSLLNYQNEFPPDPSWFTEERITETLKQIDQLHQQYNQTAATVLAPAQLEQFAKFLEQWRAMQAAGLKLGAQQFGNKGTSQPPVASQGQTP